MAARRQRGIVVLAFSLATISGTSGVADAVTVGVRGIFNGTRYVWSPKVRDVAPKDHRPMAGRRRQPQRQVPRLELELLPEPPERDIREEHLQPPRDLPLSTARSTATS